MANERTRNLVIRIADDEHEMVRKLAADAGEPASVLLRRWIRQHFVARFGDRAHATKRSETSSRAKGSTTTTR